GIDSMELLDETLKRIYAAGFDPINVDATIIAEKPKLGPYKRQIADCLADRMKLPRDCVNIKATTNEKMGFLGREEGIVAHAVALLVRK
ncbi:MAG: 2-C-methyl-D-erythritol 2,4-cyclodiphosphate synthase, partial [Candidatus Omnitrophica bacterium]|nr:2-C-methyl-D-erythritol 2,4-cyclodiphosphate synthase [Candidatus Omnitrophota bacterium]